MIIRVQTEANDLGQANAIYMGLIVDYFIHPYTFVRFVLQAPY